MTAHTYQVHQDKQSGDTRRQLLSREDGVFGIVTFHEPSQTTKSLWFRSEREARRLFTSVTR